MRGKFLSPRAKKLKRGELNEKKQATLVSRKSKRSIPNPRHKNEKRNKNKEKHKNKKTKQTEIKKNLSESRKPNGRVRFLNI